MRQLGELSCTVVVPCRNEADNVEELVSRLPKLGSRTELIFVDGQSTDGTPEVVRRQIDRHPDKRIRLLEQTRGGGKAAAVRIGFDAAEGDVLMILDADMTVAPEDLPQFFASLQAGEADVVNGDRFAFPMEKGAMPLANRLGNRVFAALFSWLIGSRIGDTLCGTKAIFKRDWPDISAARPLFGEHDVWGDFDLLLGAAYSGLKVVDVPIRYRARTAGESKMQPLKHGITMVRSTFAGFRALKLKRRNSRLKVMP